MVANAKKSSNGDEEQTKTKSIRRTARKTVYVYCRKCQRERAASFYYSATDKILDANNYMSLCKECIATLYQKIFQTEHSIERAMLRLCRMINWKYDETAIEAVKKQLETKNLTPDSENVPGFYKSRLSSVVKQEIGKRDPEQDFTFHEPTVMFNNDDLDDTVEDKDYLVRFWGKGLLYDDYVFLEEELADWRKTHKSDTKAELTLLKEICFKQLEIQKKRQEDESVSALVKELQDLMKTASIDPAKTAIAGSGKSQDTFSAFIKTIEENEPAEYYKDKALFRDFDNLDFYFKKYVTRPLKNFITQSRDFNVEEDDDGEEDDFDGGLEDGNIA